MSRLDDWVAVVRGEYGLPEIDVALLLDLAREVAHHVERPAAPVTTYLFGLAVAAGADPQATAERITALARSWAPPA